MDSKIDIREYEISQNQVTSPQIKKAKKTSFPTKKILLIAGVGAFIAGSLLLPGLPRIMKGKKLDIESFLVEDEWEDCDKARLRQRLKSLHKQKIVKIYQLEDRYVLQLTQKGKKRLLKYKLDDLKIEKPDKWDGKWRIVAYDIPKEKKKARDALRYTLRRLGFWELQKSVYLLPYACEDVVEFVRQIYEVGEHVTILTVGYLENEIAYKEYFDL